MRAMLIITFWLRCGINHSHVTGKSPEFFVVSSVNQVSTTVPAILYVEDCFSSYIHSRIRITSKNYMQVSVKDS